MYTKDDKWLLASQMQKSIRRGHVELAAQTVEKLYNIDRAYMAYRLGVVALEDIASAQKNILTEADTPWGAKRFYDKKGPDDIKKWQEFAEFLARSPKSSLACEMSHCVWWLEEFESRHGPWENISPDKSLTLMHDTSMDWWERSLFSWRSIGTKKFPHPLLKEVEGDWNTWSKIQNDPTLSVIGSKHIEPHTIFVPLAREYLKNSTITSTQFKPMFCGPWLAAALDKHTREGFAALREYYNHKRSIGLKDLGEERYNILGTLFFWTEGGALSQAAHSPSSSLITSDIRKRWLKYHNLHGKSFFDTWHDPQLLLQAKHEIIAQSKWGKNHFSFKSKMS